jgi:hypothetical protein
MLSGSVSVVVEPRMLRICYSIEALKKYRERLRPYLFRYLSYAWQAMLYMEVGNPSSERYRTAPTMEIPPDEKAQRLLLVQLLAVDGSTYIPLFRSPCTRRLNIVDC